MQERRGHHVHGYADINRKMLVMEPQYMALKMQRRAPLE
jgi:hypothetical protein